jgi:putative transposase
MRIIVRMPRKLRLLEQFGWFHITNRGVDRQDIFSTDRDREVFERQLAESADRLDIEIHAYALMTTHFHLIVHCPDGHLSEFMRDLGRRYAVHHNQHVEREGHVFTGRFLSVPIGLGDSDPDAHFATTARYVHRNPLDLVALAVLAAYRWSSFGVYVARRDAPTWLRTDVLLGLHGNDRRRLQEFTETALATDRVPAKGRDVVPYTPRCIVEVVALVAGTDAAAVLEPQPRVRNDARAMAMLLAREFRTAPCDQLADLFGVSSRQAFRRQAARAKDRLAVEEAFAKFRRRSLVALGSGEVSQNGVA